MLCCAVQEEPGTRKRQRKTNRFATYHLSGHVKFTFEVGGTGKIPDAGTNQIQQYVGIQHPVIKHLDLIANKSCYCKHAHKQRFHSLQRRHVSQHHDHGFLSVNACRSISVRQALQRSSNQANTCSRTPALPRVCREGRCQGTLSAHCRTSLAMRKINCAAYFDT